MVVFDLETTGLQIGADAIIEVCGKRLNDNLEVVDRFHSFCSYDEKLPKKIKEITNIDDEMLVGAPEESHVLDEFRNFIGDDLLVAHNYNFDGSFLIGRGLHVQNPFMCTLSMSRKLLPFLKGHGLAVLNEYLQLGLVGHHRSENDVDATVNLFRILYRMMVARGLDFTNLICRKERDLQLVPYANYEDFVPDKIEFFFPNPR